MEDKATITYNVRLHDEGEHGMWAEVLELPGCIASGFTHEDLLEALAEAIGMYLSTGDSEVEVANLEPAERQRVERFSMELVDC